MDVYVLQVSDLDGYGDSVDVYDSPDAARAAFPGDWFDWCGGWKCIGTNDVAHLSRVAVKGATLRTS